MNVTIILCIIFCIIALIAAVILFIKTGKRNSKIEETNKRIEENNKTLLAENNNLRQQKNEIEKSVSILNNQEEKLLESIKHYNWEIEEAQKNINLLKNTFSNYSDILDELYDDKEDEFDKACEELKENYKIECNKISEELQKEKDKLNKIQATRAAAIEAQLREEEIKKKLSFYCIQISNSDLADIKILEDIKPKLNNPRILSMLIWSTFFQKPMTALCNKVLGVNTICGIYKITNQKNNMCYIGQARDIAERFKQHAKCGLGIDTPQGNKLYAAMIQDGLWNFSFELLEKCTKEELNEKEKYYIKLYQSKDFGYNMTKGNGE